MTNYLPTIRIEFESIRAEASRMLHDRNNEIAAEIERQLAAKLTPEALSREIDRQLGDLLRSTVAEAVRMRIRLEMELHHSRIKRAAEATTMAALAAIDKDVSP